MQKRKNLFGFIIIINAFLYLILLPSISNAEIKSNNYVIKEKIL